MKYVDQEGLPLVVEATTSWSFVGAGLRLTMELMGPEHSMSSSTPDNGTKVTVVEFPPLDPAAEARMDPNLMMKVVGDHAPARGLPVKHPMMHRTRTVDYAVILSGETDMMLDDTVVHVKAGDVIIQQATNHAWINRGTQPCRIMFVLMDSKQP